jgi:hypothetical protein
MGDEGKEGWGCIGIVIRRRKDWAEGIAGIEMLRRVKL